VPFVRKNNVKQHEKQLEKRLKGQPEKFS